MHGPTAVVWIGRSWGGSGGESWACRVLDASSRMRAVVLSSNSFSKPAFNMSSRRQSRLNAAAGLTPIVLKTVRGLRRRLIRHFLLNAVASARVPDRCRHGCACSKPGADLRRGKRADPGHPSPACPSAPSRRRSSVARICPSQPRLLRPPLLVVRDGNRKAVQGH